MKEFLSEKGINYQEFDVARDPNALDEMVRISGKRAVPVTIIDGEVIVGFDKEKLQNLVARQQ